MGCSDSRTGVEMTVDTSPETRTRSADHALRERAKRVIPNGMYGHLSVNRLPAEYPQYYARGEGARVWDVDGNEYVDLMCSFGPNILGHQHPKVMAAAQAQLAVGDTLAGPGSVAVELAELLVDRIGGATLGDVREERHRRDPPGGHHRQGADRTDEGPASHRRVSRCCAVVLDPRRHGPARPRQHALLHVQRPRQRRSGGRRGRWRRRRHHRLPVQARRRLRPGAHRSGLRPRRPRDL